MSTPIYATTRSNPFSFDDRNRNLPVPALVEAALARGEAILTREGALRAVTGKYTGRSPKDKFLVNEPSVRDKIDWGPVNQPMDPEVFDRLYRRVTEYMEKRQPYIFDGYAGADPAHRLPIRVINELAWHNLFIRQLLIRPTQQELAEHRPELTLIVAPGFKADPARDGTRSETFIAISLERGLILIGGTYYAGEMKKSIFSVMNYLLPEQGVLPMHCSANVGEDGDVALFFGLSGTGKTTLSADPERRLIGDDEHGWSGRGIFNIEGGCYAKCIGLSREKEPQIWEAIRFGSVLENVMLDDQRSPLYDRKDITENTRAAYPVDYIPSSVVPGIAGHPEGDSLPDRRCLRRPAPDLPPDAGTGDVSLPFGIHQQTGGNRKGDRGTGSHLLRLLRRPLPPAPAPRLRGNAGRKDRRARRPGLPGEHRLVRRSLRSRKAGEARIHPGHGPGRHQGRPGKSADETRSRFPGSGPRILPGRPAGNPLAEKHLERPGTI